jgi:PadR family transcriptional regulator PadR
MPKEDIEKERFVKANLDVVVLKLLDKHSQGMWGYELSFFIRNLYNVNVSSGTLYPQLYDLENSGYVNSEVTQVSGRNRKIYKIDPEGKIFLDSTIKSSQKFWEILEGLEKRELPQISIQDISVEETVGQKEVFKSELGETSIPAELQEIQSFLLKKDPEEVYKQRLRNVLFEWKSVNIDEFYALLSKGIQDTDFDHIRIIRYLKNPVNGTGHKHLSLVWSFKTYDCGIPRITYYPALRHIKIEIAKEDVEQIKKYLIGLSVFKKRTESDPSLEDYLPMAADLKRKLEEIISYNKETVKGESSEKYEEEGPVSALTTQVTAPITTPEPTSVKTPTQLPKLEKRRGRSKDKKPKYDLTKHSISQLRELSCRELEDKFGMPHHDVASLMGILKHYEELTNPELFDSQKADETGLSEHSINIYKSRIKLFKFRETNNQ